MDTDILDLPSLTVDGYHRLIEAGAFDGMRVELLNGRVVPMSPMKSSVRECPDEAISPVRCAV